MADVAIGVTEVVEVTGGIAHTVAGVGGWDGCWGLARVAGTAGRMAGRPVWLVERLGRAGVAAGLAGVTAGATGMVVRRLRTVVRRSARLLGDWGSCRVYWDVCEYWDSCGGSGRSSDHHAVRGVRQLGGDPVSVPTSAPRPPPITDPHPDKRHQCGIGVAITTPKWHRCRWRGHQAIPGWHQAYHEHHSWRRSAVPDVPAGEILLPGGPGS